MLRCCSILAALCLTCLVAAQPAEAAKDDPEPIVVKDPQYGEVLFYFYQEDYVPAIVRLLAAQDREQLTEHTEQAELLLGGLYLSYGHHLEAAGIFDRLLADNVDAGRQAAELLLERGVVDSRPLVGIAPGAKYIKKGLLGATCLVSAIKPIALSTRSSVR